MSINWDKIANIFADHEETERRRWKRETEGNLHKHRADPMVEEAIRSLPKMLEEHLAKARVSMTTDSEWLPFFGCRTNSDPFEPSSSVTLKILVERLGGLDVRTRIFRVDTLAPTSAVLLMVNIEDLKTQARRHINRPPPELGAKKR